MTINTSGQLLTTPNIQKDSTYNLVCIKLDASFQRCCVSDKIQFCPFVIIVARSFVHTTDTTCADLCRSCADIVECRRHQNVAKSAVQQTTLAPATRLPGVGPRIT
uniref:Uncharacterized protein n=1 Tax=Ixodes ricinus TaxID=34613 RepID=A0A6B0UGH3_IXORI